MPSGVRVRVPPSALCSIGSGPTRPSARSASFVMSGEAKAPLGCRNPGELHQPLLHSPDAAFSLPGAVKRSLDGLAPSSGFWATPTSALGAPVMSAYEAPAIAAPMIGATKNNHTWASAPPGEPGDSERACRVRRAVRHRNGDEVDHGQPQADRNRRQTLRCSIISGTENDVDEDRCNDDLDDEPGQEPIAAGRAVSVPVRGKSTLDRIESGLAIRDDEEHSARDRGRDELGNDVGQDALPLNLFAIARPIVTAGLKCPPETCPNACAPTSTDRPKASETPTNPIPT